MPATIIPLPTAASAPVAQPRPRRGRYPKKVAFIKDAQLARSTREHEAHEQERYQAAEAKVRAAMLSDAERLWKDEYSKWSAASLDAFVEHVHLARLMRDPYHQKMLHCSPIDFELAELVAQLWGQLQGERTRS